MHPQRVVRGIIVAIALLSAEIQTNAQVEVAHLQVPVREPVPGLAQPLFHLWRERAFRIAIHEDLELTDGFLRFRLVALGVEHLVEMHHPELHLRTDKLSVAESVQRIIELLEKRGLLTA